MNEAFPKIEQVRRRQAPAAKLAPAAEPTRTTP
jgi:hypothetical protein